MKNAFRSKLAVATCAAIFFLPAMMAPAAQTILSGHVPPVAASLTALGTLPATAPMHLAIGLPLRNEATLNSLLQQIYDPASPNYRHYLTPEKFTEMFGPSPDDYQRVLDFARTNGLTITSTYSNRMVLGVSGAVADVERGVSRENADVSASDRKPRILRAGDRADRGRQPADTTCARHE